MKKVEERLSKVEQAVIDFTIQTNSAIQSLASEMKEFKNEMSDFKDEMLEFKEEMKDFKDEMLEFKEEMKDFKDEMKDFKVEMQEFKEETVRDRREMNKQWGGLANKMGTIVEDIVSPAVRPMVKQYFQEEVIDIRIHHRRHNRTLGINGEFDVVAVTDNRVFLVETKVSPNQEKLHRFVDEAIPRFRVLFPEYDHLPLVPVFAALRFEDDLVQTGTEIGVYMLAYREWEYMDLLNFEAIQSR